MTNRHNEHYQPSRKKTENTNTKVQHKEPSLPGPVDKRQYFGDGPPTSIEAELEQLFDEDDDDFDPNELTSTLILPTPANPRRDPNAGWLARLGARRVALIAAAALLVMSLPAVVVIVLSGQKQDNSHTDLLEGAALAAYEAQSPKAQTGSYERSLAPSVFKTVVWVRESNNEPQTLEATEEDVEEAKHHRRSHRSHRSTSSNLTTTQVPTELEVPSTADQGADNLDEGSDSSPIAAPTDPIESSSAAKNTTRTKDEVRSVVEAHKKRAMFCGGLVEKAGELRFQFSIQGDGSVTDVDLFTPGLSSGSTADCLRNVVSSMHFRATGEAPSTVKYKYRFSDTEDWPFAAKAY